MAYDRDGTVDRALPLHLRLLLLLAHTSLNSGQLRTVRSTIAQPELDWDLLLVAAAQHRMMPLIGRQVIRHRLDEAPHGVESFRYASTFVGAYFGNRHRNLALRDECGRVFNRLTDCDLRFAVRKGFSVVEAVYGDPFVRHITDLDLVVAPEDLGRLNGALRQLGYVRATGGPLGAAGAPKEGHDDQRGYVLREYRGDIVGFGVDASDRVFNQDAGAGVEATSLLARAVPRDLCGTRALSLENADQLLDLCARLHDEATDYRAITSGVHLQAAKLLDIALLARLLSVRCWQILVARARSHNLGAATYFSLYFVAQLYPHAIPDGALTQLKPPNLDYLDEHGSVDGGTTRWGEAFPLRMFSEASR